MTVKRKPLTTDAWPLAPLLFRKGHAHPGYPQGQHVPKALSKHEGAYAYRQGLEPHAVSRAFSKTVVGTVCQQGLKPHAVNRDFSKTIVETACQQGLKPHAVNRGFSKTIVGTACQQGLKPHAVNRGFSKAVVETACQQGLKPPAVSRDFSKTVVETACPSRQEKPDHALKTTRRFAVWIHRVMKKPIPICANCETRAVMLSTKVHARIPQIIRQHAHAPIPRSAPCPTVEERRTIMIASAKKQMHDCYTGASVAKQAFSANMGSSLLCPTATASLAT